MNFQTQYASSYDLLYADKDYDQETNLLISLINDYSSSNETNSKSILEIGCGTGEHALRLLDHGHELHAIDKSQSMLALAKRKLSNKEKVVFSCEDITTFNTQSQYDVVLMMFHVFSYLEKNEQVELALKNIRSALRPGGIFIFDYWNTLGVNNFGPSKTTKNAQSDKLKVSRVATPAIVNEKLIDVNYELELTKVNEAPTSFNETHRMRHFHQNEIEEFLKQADLESIKSYGWGKKTAPTKNDWANLTIACRA